MVAQCSPIGWRLWILSVSYLFGKNVNWFKIPLGSRSPSHSPAFPCLFPGSSLAGVPLAFAAGDFAIYQYTAVQCTFNVHWRVLQSFVFWLETATLRDLLNLCPLDAAGRLRGCECLLGSQWRFPHNCVRKGEAQEISISQSDACHRANMTNPTTSSVVEDVLTTCCLLPFKREITVFKQIKKVLGFVKWEAILEGCSMCCLMLPP